MDGTVDFPRDPNDIFGLNKRQWIRKENGIIIYILYMYILYLFIYIKA